MAKIVLASASIRRVELLAQLGLTVSQCAANIDESPLPGEAAREYVCRLAKTKAESIEASPQQWVIAADTTLEVDGAIVGKPSGYEHFCDIISQLSDTHHVVRTGVAVRRGARTEVTECETQVWMKPISAAERDGYWNSGEPLGKAGGYAIQGLGAAFIARIEGSYSNVVGLPLYETTALLSQSGFSIFDTGDASCQAGER